MKKSEFEKLKEGDIVILNGLCHNNAGIKCIVVHIVRDKEERYCRLMIKTADGAKNLSIIGGILTNWNEISYKSANVL